MLAIPLTHSIPSGASTMLVSGHTGVWTSLVAQSYSRKGPNEIVASKWKTFRALQESLEQTGKKNKADPPYRGSRSIGPVPSLGDPLILLPNWLVPLHPLTETVSATPQSLSGACLHDSCYSIPIRPGPLRALLVSGLRTHPSCVGSLRVPCSGRSIRSLSWYAQYIA